MQTFLPYPDFDASAAVLDHRRLGKQRVETLQIMKALLMGKGWVNHPATKMWRGFEYALLEYQEAICREWHINRGFEDTCLRKTYQLFWTNPYLIEDKHNPWWLGDNGFHMAHRSNLVRKDPEFYGPRFPDIPDNLEYVWPG